MALSVGDMCMMLEGVNALQAGRYDTALPQQWVNAMDEQGVSVRGSFVWDYTEDRIFGRPKNISALFVEYFGEQVKPSEVEED